MASVQLSDLIVDVLAAHRLTRLVVEDTVTQPIREAVFNRYPPHETSPSYVLTCSHCSGIWIAAGIVAARATAPRAWQKVSYALAIAGAASLLSDWRERT